MKKTLIQRRREAKKRELLDMYHRCTNKRKAVYFWGLALTDLLAQSLEIDEELTGICDWGRDEKDKSSKAE